MIKGQEKTQDVPSPQYTMKGKAAATATNHDDVYDRQIRLWGAEAQKRMSTARVLYIHLSGVSCEILKNLILAGVAAVICDGRAYPTAVREVPSSFFVAEEMEKSMMIERNSDNDEEPVPPMAKRAKVTRMTVADAVMTKIDELNPLLHGRNSIEDRDLMSLPPSYFGKFDAIVASRLTVEEVKFISSCLSESGTNEDASVGEEKRRENEQNNNERNTLFIVADTFGLEGCAHLDFGKNHTYRREIGKDKLSDMSKVDPYVSMHDMFTMPLCKVKTGRWDKVIPRGLLLQRLLIDYWGQQRTENQAEKDGDHHRFVDFATKWFVSNNLSNNDESAANQINLLQLSPIAAHPEISPVSATLGGLLGNEVIKALTGRGEPANNILLFDGVDGGCRSFVLCCGEKEDN